jgi:multicomponent K+:H+ antiporter subunit G
MPFWLELIICALLLGGSLFALIGAFALAKLPDFYTRLHGPAKATTLGLGGIMIASMLFFTYHNGALSVHELLIALFLFMTAPVSAHMLAKAALHLELPIASGTRCAGLAARPPKGRGAEAGRSE